MISDTIKTIVYKEDGRVRFSVEAAIHTDTVGVKEVKLNVFEYPYRLSGTPEVYTLSFVYDIATDTDPMQFSNRIFQAILNYKTKVS